MTATGGEGPAAGRAFRWAATAPGGLMVAYAVLVLLAAVYVVSLLVRPIGGPTAILDGWVVDAFEITASLLCLARAARRGARAVPLLLGAGLLSWALGDTVLSLESLSGTVTSPSWSDPLWLASYPLLYGGVVMLVRRQLARTVPAVWLDGAVASLGAAAVCATFLLPGIERSVGGRPWRVAVDLAYPVGDLVLLALVVGFTAIQPGRRSRQWLLVAGACLLNAVGDTYNVFPSAAMPSGTGAFFDGVAWPVATLLISMAVWLSTPRRRPPDSPETPGFTLPGLAALGAFVILSSATMHAVSPAALGLATVTLAVAGLRLVLAVHGLRSITAERHRQSMTDDLTGMANRRRLFEVLDAFFAQGVPAGDANRPLALLFVDLNHFKEVNDSFGHAAGDAVLRQLAPRLRASLGPDDLLVRLGGDELAVVLEDSTTADAVSVAQAITSHLLAPFALEAVDVNVTASIGIATAPADAASGADLVRCADVAMYRAKAGGQPFAVFHRELDDARDRLHLLEELRAAVAARALTLHYQTQVDPRCRRVTGVEALLRWEHPRLGPMSPVDFVPLAEEAGLMGPLTALVLDDALGQAAAWRRSGRHLTMSVNISASNLSDPGFASSVESALALHGLPGEGLVLEITETTIISDFERSIDVIERMRSLGVGVSIDDFGAGVTSLAYLRGLAATELKLDRSFLVGPDETTARDLALIGATIDLAHALQMRVVAEGVEDQALYDRLTGLGCDLLQGFHLSRPVPAAEVVLDPIALVDRAGTPAAAPADAAAPLDTAAPLDAAAPLDTAAPAGEAPVTSQAI